MPLRPVVVAIAIGLAGAFVAVAANHTSASPGDVYITQLSCDSSPEFVRIKNFGGSSQSLGAD